MKSTTIAPKAPSKMDHDVSLKATFNRCVDLTLEECTSISNQRGGEYADSWALENQSTLFFDHVFRLLSQLASPLISSNPELEKEEKRLLILASLVDVKLSRLLGGYKRDTYVDLINYVSALAQLLREYVGEGDET